MTQPPLAGYRILSMAEQFPGSFATLLLADLGADVILVERPAGGDPTRRFPGHFEALNRNKRSVALDLKSAAGKEAFLRLADTADAVIEGYRPGVVQRLGIGPEALRERHPELVYVSISAFGQSGPLSHLAGHDLSIQAVAGLLNIPLGTESQSALPVLPLSDVASGMFAALGIVTSLLARTRSPTGATVDVSMLDSLVCWMTPLIVPAINTLKPAPFPPDDPGYGVFVSADARQFTLSIAGEDHMWRQLCELLSLEDLSQLPAAQRVAQRQQIMPRLRPALAAHPRDWLFRHFETRKIAFAPVNQLTDVPDDPQITARGLFVNSTGPTGALRYIRQPLLIDGQGGTVGAVAPQLAEHNDEIFTELGYDAAELQRLRGVELVK
jgi:crotonobetainyl-CoA:carnitine CoA-transferase CaiB-like acyl-CoA transferase